MPLLQSAKKLRPLQLTAIIFLTVSGGPYGLEPLLNFAGTHAALLLLILTPLLWDIPTIFCVMELNSMLPVTGGYYQWVKRAIGIRTAFFEGWWTWLYTFVDLAIYPVLFITYAAYLFPQIQEYKIIICLVIIWLSAILNIWGVMPVGRVSIILGAIVLIPFILLLFFAWHNGVPFNFPALSFSGSAPSSIGMGLYTVMWNYIGWDNATTYAEEVDRPVRSYIISIGAAFLLIFCFYIITILIAQQSGVDPRLIEEKGFPVLGKIIGGNWLGKLIAIGGMASSLGLYSAVLLSVSRVPEVMAEDKLLPASLCRLHSKFNTPYVSIICCSVVVSFLVFWDFEELLIIDIILYGAGLSLEFVALILLRIKEPGLVRPFRIPLNIAGLILMLLVPFTIYLFALVSALIHSDNTLSSALFAISALISAPVIWFLFSLRKKALAD